jgi:hypothetical protein
MQDEALEGVARDHERRRARYARLATVGFLGLAVSALAHLVTGQGYASLAYVPTTVVVDVLLVVIWGLSAFATSSRWSRVALVPLLGCAASFLHAFLASMSTPWSGWPYLLVGVVVTYAVLRALPLLRRPTPMRRPVHRDEAAMPASTPH